MPRPARKPSPRETLSQFCLETLENKALRPRHETELIARREEVIRKAPTELPTRTRYQKHSLRHPSERSVLCEFREGIKVHFPQIAIRVRKTAGIAAPKHLLRPLDDGGSNLFCLL